MKSEVGRNREKVVRTIL